MQKKITGLRMTKENDLLESKKVAAITTLKKAAETWPTSYVARTEIKIFTGGALSPSYMANLDCSGNSCEGMFKIGRHVCYDKGKLTDWLISRLQV